MFSLFFNMNLVGLVGQFYVFIIFNMNLVGLVRPFNVFIAF